MCNLRNNNKVLSMWALDYRKLLKSIYMDMASLGFKCLISVSSKASPYQRSKAGTREVDCGLEITRPFWRQILTCVNSLGNVLTYSICL